jgi:hypothetical membrane protein
MTNPRLVWVPGYLAAAVYILCVAVAYVNYPLAYSPLENWLSDLGNPIINPTGAFAYNLGCVLAGLCLVFFFFGLNIWNDGHNKGKNLLSIAQVTGILSAIFLIVSALFPLGAHTPIHSISGKAHIFFAGFFLTFSATILLRQPHGSKWLALFGFLAAVVNFGYGAFLHAVFIAEWAAIGMFILYVLLLSGNAQKQTLDQLKISKATAWLVNQDTESKWR